VVGITLGGVTISRNRSNKILPKQPGGHGESASRVSRSAAEVIRSDPAAEPLAFLEEVVVAKVGATAAEEALQEVKMALEARVLTRPPIFSSALMVAVMKAGRVTCWCGTNKSARLPREQES
jgi:hypothetical protein